MSYIYLIRHGETTWNLEERFQGTTDTELTPKGYEQGAHLADRLKQTPFNNIFTSPLQRARITASLIAASQEAQAQEDEDFREISFGKWEGMTTGEIQAAYPWMDQWFHDPGAFQIPDGAILEDEKARLKRRLIDIAEGGGNTAIVSHAGVIRLSLLSALDLPLSYYWRFVFGNTSISILEYHRGVFLLRCLNDTSHLSGK